MKVKEIMTCSAETVSSTASLKEAAQKMKALQVGSLPVQEGEEMVGFITDRDIAAKAVAEGKNVNTTSVKEIMNPEVFHCFEEDNIRDAARIMEEKSIHRLLVLNSNYEPVGMVSLADIAVKSHDEHLTYEVIERICEPASPIR
jgi:CBS domain-containing protein